MSGLIAGLNPAAKLTNEAEAKASARASAVSILLGVIWGLVGLAWMMSPEGAASIREAMVAAEAQMAGMADTMSGVLIGTAVVTVVAQVVFALIQWAKPNLIVPIIFLLLVVYGLLTSLMSVVMADQLAAMTGPQPEVAPWITYGNLVILVVRAVLHVAGIRGASALSKFRRAAA